MLQARADQAQEVADAHSATLWRLCTLDSPGCHLCSLFLHACRLVTNIPSRQETCWWSSQSFDMSMKVGLYVFRPQGFFWRLLLMPCCMACCRLSLQRG